MRGRVCTLRCCCCLIFFDDVLMKELMMLKIGSAARACCLEALAVDNARAGLIVFLLGDPHLLEGGQ
jgi:hypothetical protein